MENNLLTSQEVSEVMGQIEEISEVIHHRRVPNPESDPKEKKLDEEIAVLVSEFKKSEE